MGKLLFDPRLKDGLKQDIIKAFREIGDKAAIRFLEIVSKDSALDGRIRRDAESAIDYIKYLDSRSNE